MAGANGTVLEKLRADVPGYRGYEDPSARRDTDRAFRTKVADSLTGEVHYLGRLISNFRGDANGNVVAFVEHVDRLRSNLETAIAVVRSAPESCAAFFDAARVAKPDLERVGGLDVEIYELMTDVGERAYRLPMASNMLKECLRVCNMVIELERLSGARDAAMAGVR